MDAEGKKIERDANFVLGTLSLAASSKTTTSARGPGFGAANTPVDGLSPA